MFYSVLERKSSLDTPYVYFIYILDFPTQLFGSQQNMW